MKKRVIFLACFAMMFGMAVYADDAAAPAPAAAPAAEAVPAPAPAPEAKTETVVVERVLVRQVRRGALPAHHKDVVTKEQREKIYEIQAEYAEKIRALEEQVKQIRAERDKKISDLLTDEQRTQVETRREEARLRRTARQQ